jgi:hypothetical protein
MLSHLIDFVAFVEVLLVQRALLVVVEVFVDRMKVSDVRMREEDL